ncbi:cold-shock protein [Saccharopolyspora cebuensis]|uniref:Cold-shock protein n=1 Tax=Saccharopolyspora cebuensis TaxID=418759 RepID=A0ABV4CGA7_9PSEU
MDTEGEHVGRVRVWHTEYGWGVVEVAGEEVWAHFSRLEATGFRALAEGDRVRLRVEAAEQDGYRWRATWVRRLPERRRGRWSVRRRTGHSG